MKKVLKMAKETDLAESKGEIIAYLQTAQDIEKDIYMLETSCEELEKKAQEEDELAKKILHDNYGYYDPHSGKRKDSVKKLQNEIEEYRNKISNPSQYDRPALLPTTLKTTYKSTDEKFKYLDGTEHFTRNAVIISIINVLIGFFLCVAPTLFRLSDTGAGTFLCYIAGNALIWLCWLFGTMSSSIYSSVKASRERIEAAASENAKNKVQNRENALENERIKKNYITKQREAIRNIEQKIVKLQALADKHTANAQYYREQIENVKKDLEPLYRNRITFYSDGVVPVDYRTMDCVYVLEQIFRNDLADTMREAVLMYEERVFRGEIIRGMANIAAHIDSLSSVMSHLRTDIDRISRDVAIMREDMDQIYEDNREFANDIKKSNDKLYEETKLHRHALEALDNSNRALLGYAEKDRQSLEELAKSNQKLVDYIEDN